MQVREKETRDTHFNSFDNVKIYDMVFEYKIELKEMAAATKNCCNCLYLDD